MISTSVPARIAVCLIGTLAVAPLASPAEPPQNKKAQEIEAGFRLLYETKFSAARTEFAVWERSHPDDPLGPAAEAASYLYEELYEQGVFTSEFFLNDKKLLNGVDKPADPTRKEAFLATSRRAEDAANTRLKENPSDARALLALTMVGGMQSDFAGLIEKHQLETLKYMHRAENDADKLLAVDPTAQDGYVALGASHYILGCLPSYKRFFLKFGGMGGNRQKGMNELKMASDHGHYLAPFAKSLLALTALREKNPDLARDLFTELTADYPQNPVFARELAKLNHKTAAAQGDPPAKQKAQPDN